MIWQKRNKRKAYQAKKTTQKAIMNQIMDYVKKKKNDWEEDVCCRTYMGAWMEKFITVNFFAKDRFFPRSV